MSAQSNATKMAPIARMALVIGGSAAVQQFLRQFTGSPAAAGEGAPGLLYIVSVPTFGRPRVLRLKY